jgi:hypothetical protein
MLGGETVSDRAMPAAEDATTDHSATIRRTERERTCEREMVAPPFVAVYPIAQPLR